MSNNHHYQSKVIVCVCNQWAFADNRADAVDRLLIGTTSPTDCSDLSIRYKTWSIIHTKYCDVPGSPCLSETGPVYGPFFFFFKIFRQYQKFSSNSPTLHLAPCLVAARCPDGLLETHPAGTRQYIQSLPKECIHLRQNQVLIKSRSTASARLLDTRTNTTD